MTLHNAFGELALEATQDDVKTAVESIDGKTPALSSGRVPVALQPAIVSSGLLNGTGDAVVVRPQPTRVTRFPTTEASASGVGASSGLTVRQTGSGMAVSQASGNLIITSGTTGRAETIIRSTNPVFGNGRFRYKSILSQRIANVNFIVELVDVIGDGLAYSIGSATAVTVTFPTGTASAVLVGQSFSLVGWSGTGTFLSGRYPVASVSGDNVTFTVSGFATGSGTVSVVGGSFNRVLYDGTTATAALWDVGRDGYSLGNTTLALVTSASPGHLVGMTTKDLAASIQDQLTASGTTIPTALRGTRVEHVPSDKTLYLQIRVVNLGTNPASTTTWTLSALAHEDLTSQDVSITDSEQAGVNALPVDIMRSGTLTTTVSSTTALTPGVAAANLGKAEDAVHASGDTGVFVLAVRNDNLAAADPSANGDYTYFAVDSKGAIFVESRPHTTSTLSNVTSSATNVTLLALNASRRGASIYNDSTQILYLKLGATASSTSFTLKLGPDQYYEVPFGYTGIIDGIWASANGAARVTEVTA